MYFPYILWFFFLVSFRFGYLQLAFAFLLAFERFFFNYVVGTCHGAGIWLWAPTDAVGGGAFFRTLFPSRIHYWEILWSVPIQVRICSDFAAISAHSVESFEFRLFGNLTFCILFLKFLGKSWASLGVPMCIAQNVACRAWINQTNLIK